MNLFAPHVTKLIYIEQIKAIKYYEAPKIDHNRLYIKWSTFNYISDINPYETIVFLIGEGRNEVIVS